MSGRAVASGYILRPPESPEDWAAYHEIRRRAIFEAYLPDKVYQVDHPDEQAEGNFPLVLTKDGKIVGCVRVDLYDAERAALRLLAVAPEAQRQGHGEALLALIDDFVRSHGRRRIVLHGNPETVGFYLRNGYVEEVWADDPALEEASVDVAKNL